ncbi:hypothetical protein EVAR_81714_1 [Eumeta japonica]|uniref:Uncharacterized protein n=1 Tax=Eumeta variegata TaxID=151549 RepID=A0A4C1UHF0_EUMVA|nr:hypothetical protein EVAR_81714_1 [Eumeta japonica]
MREFSPVDGGRSRWPPLPPSSLSRSVGSARQETCLGARPPPPRSSRPPPYRRARTNPSSSSSKFESVRVIESRESVKESAANPAPHVGRHRPMSKSCAERKCERERERAAC